MAGLKIKLKPEQMLVIGGVPVVNGGKSGTELVFPEPGALFLLSEEIVQPDVLQSFSGDAGHKAELLRVVQQYLLCFPGKWTKQERERFIGTEVMRWYGDEIYFDFVDTHYWYKLFVFIKKDLGL